MYWRSDIASAREMLLFTSATLCVAVTHFDGKPIGRDEQAGRPGPVALWLKDALLEHMGISDRVGLAEGEVADRRPAQKATGPADKPSDAAEAAAGKKDA